MKHVFYFLAMLVLVSVSCVTSTKNMQENPARIESEVVTALPENTQIENPTAEIFNPPQADFSLDNANTVPPDDIINEVAYFAVGGAWECPEELRSTPTFVGDSPFKSEWLGEVYITSCGWQTGDVIDITIIYPNGKKETSRQIQDLENNSPIYVLINASDDMQLGDYVVTLDGANHHLETTLNIYMPNERRVYLIADDVMLYHFEPNENVRLFAYDLISTAYTDMISLVGWMKYQVDSSGNLVINVAESSHRHFYVVGEISGLVEPINQYRFALSAPIFPRPQPCNGLPSRLLVGIKARATFTDGSNMRIRANPGFSQKILNKVPEGTQINIIQGFECADDSTWWYVQTVTGLAGWMAEYQGNTYLLEPMP